MSKTQPRDKEGWRIPHEGTKSKAIYDMLRSGAPRREILNRVHGSRTALRVLIWRMKHPGASH